MHSSFTQWELKTLLGQIRYEGSVPETNIISFKICWKLAESLNKYLDISFKHLILEDLAKLKSEFILSWRKQEDLILKN